MYNPHSLQTIFNNLRMVDPKGLLKLSDGEDYDFETLCLSETSRVQPIRGFFIIVDRTSGFVFVGSALDCRNVLKNHSQMLRRDMHKNDRLQQLYNTSGVDQFYVTIVYCQDLSVIAEAVQWLLTTFRNQGVILNKNFRPKVSGTGPVNHYDDTVYTVYTFTHRQTGKFYVGTTKNPSSRKGAHLWALRNNRHVNPLLQSLWDHSPEDRLWDWKFTVLGDKEAAFTYEQSIITANEGNGLMLNLATDVWDNIGSCTTEEQRAAGRKKASEQASKSLSRAITVLGVDYPSASAAALALGKNQTTVSRWANDPKDQRAVWREGPKMMNPWSEEAKARVRGENNSVAKRIVVNNRWYGSVKEAMVAEGIDEKRLRARANDRDDVDVYWG